MPSPERADGDDGNVQLIGEVVLVGHGERIFPARFSELSLDYLEGLHHHLVLGVGHIGVEERGRSALVLDLDVALCAIECVSVSGLTPVYPLKPLRVQGVPSQLLNMVPELAGTRATLGGSKNLSGLRSETFQQLIAHKVSRATDLSGHHATGAWENLPEPRPRAPDRNGLAVVR